MYPFSSLPENLTAFCDALRRQYGFGIGPAELRDAVRALEVVPIHDEGAVRDALRPILSGSAEQAAVFDRAFRDFFLPAGAGVQQERFQPPVPSSDAGEADPDRRAAPRQSRRQAEVDEAGQDRGPRTALTEAEPEPAARKEMLRASYSPLPGVGEPPLLVRADEAWRAAAGRLVRRVRAGRSRRWRPALRGIRFDLRRTLRASVQSGGEVGRPRWLARPRRNPRFVVLIDGSRSMAPYADAALRMSVAIASVTSRIDVFTFSTTLRPVTRDVRRAAAGEPRRLPPLHYAWGGGTSIGRCLYEFTREYGGRLLGHDTVVVIVSDGLDLGQPELLRDVMRELHQRSAGIVWLNPLLDTPGYEPTAAGMRIARPFVTTFAFVKDAASFDRLSRSIRERA